MKRELGGEPARAVAGDLFAFMIARQPALRGSTVVYLRQMLQRRELEAAFLARLSAQDANAFRLATASAWVPYLLATQLLERAAPLLYPGKLGVQRLLGRDLARTQLAGVYRVLLRLSTVNFLLTQTARVWATYHSVGRARLNDEQADGGVHLLIEDYPEYTSTMRESLCGFVVGALELVGAHDPRVVQKESTPACWDFWVTWK